MSVEPNPARNPDISSIITELSGNFYAFSASGGFVLEQGFETIGQLPDSSFVQIDVTNTVQILFDVRTFNAKLGIVKDGNNQIVEQTTYDETNQVFGVDQITISANDFQQDMLTNGASNIVSVGKYSTMYEDFETYVHTYFGYFGGFASLFDKATLYDISGGFDASAMYDLMTLNTFDAPVNGAYVKDLSGSVVISNINQLLRRAVDANVFGNRNVFPVGNYQDGDASTNFDASQNFGVADGFVADDLIYVPEGTQITLNLDIAPEAYQPFNNLGPNQPALATLIAAQNTLFQGNASQENTFTDLGGGFSHSTSTSLVNINRVLKAPMLIRLANLSAAIVDESVLLTLIDGYISGAVGTVWDLTTGLSRPDIQIIDLGNGSYRTSVSVSRLPQVFKVTFTGGTDLATGETMDPSEEFTTVSSKTELMSNTSANVNVTPITTMLADVVEEDIASGDASADNIDSLKASITGAKTTVSTTLGIDETELRRNFIQTKNKSMAKLVNKINAVSRALKKGFGGNFNRRRARKAMASRLRKRWKQNNKLVLNLANVDAIKEIVDEAKETATEDEKNNMTDTAKDNLATTAGSVNQNIDSATGSYEEVMEKSAQIDQSLGNALESADPETMNPWGTAAAVVANASNFTVDTSQQGDAEEVAPFGVYPPELDSEYPTGVYPPFLDAIDIYVSGGSMTGEPYAFYSDSAGTTAVTSLDVSETYRFQRLNSLESHPFYISDAGVELASTTITLTGDGSPTSGIKGSETFVLNFNGLTNSDTLHYYCTSHPTVMKSTFTLTGGDSGSGDSGSGSGAPTPGWKKVFKQTAPYVWSKGYESSPLNNMKNHQLNTESDDNYSIMNEIFNSSTRDNYKYNGVYKFKMVNTQDYELTWTQTGNPFDHTDEVPGAVSDISAVNFTLASDSAYESFDGLHVTNAPDWTILEGATSGYSRYSIGEVKLDPPGNSKLNTISTANDNITYSDWVELYAYVSDTA
jgi:hypothetical protein